MTQDAAVRPPGRSRRSLRVLIVEDEALVALELDGMLRLAGHDVLGTADDLPSALAAAARDRPDLALVDVQLARGASGLDVAAALKAFGVPVIFATGNCPADGGRGLALGCLHKPFSDRSLALALETAEAATEGRPAPDVARSAFHAY